MSEMWNKNEKKKYIYKWNFHAANYDQMFHFQTFKQKIF